MIDILQTIDALLAAHRAPVPFYVHEADLLAALAAAREEIVRLTTERDYIERERDKGSDETYLINKPTSTAPQVDPWRDALTELVVCNDSFEKKNLVWINTKSGTVAADHLLNERQHRELCLAKAWERARALVAQEKSIQYPCKLAGTPSAEGERHD